MREIHTDQIAETVAGLCIESNYFLGEDVLAALRQYREAESSSVGREVLDQILENAEIASNEKMPLCQDCGLTVIFVELGQHAHVVGRLQDRVEPEVRAGQTIVVVPVDRVDPDALQPAEGPARGLVGAGGRAHLAVVQGTGPLEAPFAFSGAQRRRARVMNADPTAP